METTSTTNFWWLKSNITLTDPVKLEDAKGKLTSTPRQTEDPSTVSSSLREFLEKERALESPEDADTDIGSIIEEINKLAAESPLGPYENDNGDRSVEDIMKEAEKIYMESSKSFEQLSVRSRTSANLSVSFDDTPKSTPTPKSASPLPLDYDKDAKDEDVDEYSDDFEDKSEVGTPSTNRNLMEISAIKPEIKISNAPDSSETVTKLATENKNLLENINVLKAQLEESTASLAKTKATLNLERNKSPETNNELERALEELKDSKETNTALQLQLSTLNKTHVQLKSTYEELLTSNNNLEKRVNDAESVLSKFTQELESLTDHREKLLENETKLNNSLEIEKVQVRNLKLQNEKDARCILDLNRQVKEMERIIARKHPDSVSALIVAAKNDQSENNLSARKVLEDRIKNLESEVVVRDQQSSKLFLEVQEKFGEMKNKYESHIEDLELHVSDLKNQIKSKRDLFDVYTQTIINEQKPVKDASSQTASHKLPPKLPSAKKLEKVECRDDAHLLATIRGLQADLVNKEKVILKMHKELDEAKKTNKRLQKEREGSLRNIAERREFRSFPEKLALQLRSPKDEDINYEEELKALRIERDKMRIQLCRMEEDYQNLKSKRLFDLSALQQAHESELKTYMVNITPLREQLQSHQLTIEGLQEQLKISKDQIEILRRDREELIKRLHLYSATNDSNPNQVVVDNPSNKKIAVMGRKCEENECRLKAIIQELVQNQMSNRGCQQCLARQQQLIVYKTELDQLLATVRTLA